MTLYEIDQGLLEIMEATDPETGEWIGDLDAWEQLSLEREVKLDNTACYIKDLRARAEDITEEVKVLQKRKKALDSKAAWLMENLRRSLDGQNFETARCTVKFKRNPESVRFTAEDETMKWCIEHRQDIIRYGKPTLSKDELKVLLKAGEEIPGAELVRETRMEVR